MSDDISMINDLQNEIYILECKCSTYEDRRKEYAEMLNELHNNYGELTMQHCQLKLSEQALREQLEELKIEFVSLQEDYTRKVKINECLNQRNYNLNQEIQNMKREKRILEKRIVEQELYKEQRDYYKERFAKVQEMIELQEKYVDLLNTTIEDKQGKSDILCGNFKSVTGFFKSRAPDNSVERDARAQKLVREIDRLKQEVLQDPPERLNSGKKTVVLCHEFVSRISTTLLECSVCSNVVKLGSRFRGCSNCSMIIHPDCVGNVTRRCGSSCEVKREEQTVELIRKEGWIEVQEANSDEWRKFYACINNNDHLVLYEKEPTVKMAPVKKIDLNPANGWGIVHERCFLWNVKNTDAKSLPLVFSINMHQNSDRRETYYIKVQSADEKISWVAALNQIFEERYPEICTDVETAIELPEGLQPNCVARLAKRIHLLGSDDGLYASTSPNTLVKIEGVRLVTKICILKSINTVIMMAESNVIATLLLNLKSLAKSAPFRKPTLKYDMLIDNTVRFCNFEANDRFLCAATNNQLFILKYDLKVFSFKLLEVVNVHKRITCMSLKGYDLLFCSHSLSKIDLKTPAVAKNVRKLSSTIKTVLLLKKYPPRYLLCTSHCGSFLDDNGVETVWIQWHQSPLHISFVDPILYVVQSDAIELIKIPPKVSTSRKKSTPPKTVVLDVPDCTFLGENNTGIYVKHENEVIYINGTVITGDDLSLDSSYFDENLEGSSDKELELRLS